MQLRGYLLATLAACGGNGIDITSDAAVDAGTDTTLSDAGPDATSPCGTGETLCGNTCFANDVNHCGPSCVTCGAPALGVATCDGTTCGFTCTFMQCGSTCADPSKDTHNCGSCGRDCVGEVCTSGMCQPDEIYSGVGPDTLVVDATNLYWVQGGTTKLMQGPKGGGTAMLLTSGAEGLVAVDATYVYYVGSNDISIVAIPIGGGTSVFATSPGTAFTIKRAAVDAKQNVYFTTGYPTATLESVGVLDGGPVTAISSVLGMQWFDVRAGQPYVAWRDFNPPYFTRFGPTTTDGGVVPLAILDAGTAAAATFVLDSNNAYLAASPPALYQIPLDGGASTLLATSAGMGIVAVATDGKYVYWATGGGSSEIDRLAIGTTTKEVLVPGGVAIGFSGLAVDGMYVYYGYSSAISPGKNGIYRIAK